MYATKIRPFHPDDYVSESRGRVESGDTAMDAGGRSKEVGLNSSRLFGPEGEEGCCSAQAVTVRPDGVRVCSYCSLEIPESAARENIRSFIELPVPVLNPILIGSNGKVLAKILNIREGLMKDIIECRQIMRRSDNEFVKASSVATCHAGDYMIHGEIIEHYFDTMHIDRMLSEEFFSILEKIKPMDEDSTGDTFEFSTIGNNTVEYYADNDEDAAKIQKTLTEAIDKALLNPFGRLTLLANADRRAVENMLMTNIRVMPAGIRPVIDKRQDPLTELYRTVIEESEKVSILSEHDDVQKVCQRIKALVLSVHNLFIGVKNDPKLKGFLERLQHKEGHIRDRMLGKRTNYSGRSVIVVDPTLDLNECSIPKAMALRIFSYHIKRFKALEAMSDSRQSLSDLEILEKRVIPHIPILLNRAPTLHRLSFLAYMVKLSDNMAIGLHPLACSGFNADFDGDTMAAHVPLSDDAVMEAVTLLAATSNAYIPANGESTFLPRQEAVYGLHYLTKEKSGFSDPDNRTFASLQEIYDAVKSHSIHAHARISFTDISDTAGRFAVWSCLPERHRQQMKSVASDGTTGLPIVTKKVLNEIVTNLHQVKTSAFKRHMNKLLEIAFVAATLYAPTLNTLINLPASLKKTAASFDSAVADLVADYADGFVMEDEFNSRYLSTFNAMMSELGKTVMIEIDDASPGNGYCSLVESGAKGDSSNLIQMFVCKGQVRRAGGAFNAVIRSSLCDQMSGLEQFVAASGTRASMMDKSNKPSDTGDLWRRLNYACASVVIRETDCGTNDGLLISKSKLAEYLGTWKDVDGLFLSIIRGRYTTRVEDVEINARLAEEIVYGVKNAEGDFSVHPTNTVTTDAGVIMRKDFSSAAEFLQAITGKIRLGHDDEFITPEVARRLGERESVAIRSPLKCAHHVCAKCYGLNLVNNKNASVGTPVGFIAAQSIGEPATQLTMRTFHKGGVVGGADIVSAFDRFERLCEVTDLSPKKCSTYDPVAWATGPVISQEIGMKKKISIGDNPKTMLVPLHAMLKDYVTKGDGLGAEAGDKDIKELIEYAGFEAAADYLLFMLFLAYHGQAVINIKHFEILTSSMIREWIVDSVNPEFKIGTHMSIYERQMVADGVRTKRVILGLKKIPRNTIHPFENFAFQYLGDGIAAANIRGGSDKVTAPYSRIMMGLPPVVGTHFSSYLADEQLISQTHGIG